MGDKPRLHLTHPIYPDLTIRNGGHLPWDKRAFALWYFYTLAQSSFEAAGGVQGTEGQVILEGELWMDPQYENIARMVAIRYQFDSPDEFLKPELWQCVAAQAASMGYPKPRGEYMRPLRLVGFR